MAEHWEWVQSYATGNWQIFIGQDDGIQEYFFELADKLVAICDKKKLQVIMSERAYYFWEGCEETYGDCLFSYYAVNKSRILNSKKEMKKALWETGIGYMDIPSMYTTSLFSKKFIDNIKSRLDGHLFVTHPQDANLAAYTCLFTNHYLKSYIPLGWVGSSPKSAGLAIVNLNSKEDKLGREYYDTIKKSVLPYHKLAYDFRIDSFQLYFWSALLSVTEKCDMQKIHKFLISKNTKVKLFSFIYHDKHITGESRQKLDSLFKINDITIEELEQNILRMGGGFLRKKIYSLYYRIKKIFNRLNRRNFITYSLAVDKEISKASLFTVSSYIYKKIKQTNLFNRIYVEK